MAETAVATFVTAGGAKRPGNLLARISCKNGFALAYNLGADCRIELADCPYFLDKKHGLDRDVQASTSGSSIVMNVFSTRDRE